LAAGLFEETEVTAFLAVLGLAVLALLLVRAAAAFARPEARKARCTHAEVARCDRPRRLHQTSRSAAGPRSIIHALRAPGPLCERASGVTLRHAAPHALGVAVLSACARMRARVVPASG
jgi:hypothetical protein